MNFLAPSVPGNLIILPEADALSVNWSYTTSFIKFEVVYGRDDEWPNRIGEFDAPQRTCRITALQPETKYFVEVRAQTNDGPSAWKEGTATTKAATAKPVAPTELSARPTKDTVALTWKGSDLAAGYRVSYGLQPDGPVINTITASLPACMITGLSSGTAYYFDLLAFNSAGDSPSVRTSATTLQVPARPTDLRATPAILTMDLTWSPSPGAIEYVIRYGVEPGGPPQTIVTRPSNYELTGLSKNTLYFVEVSARNINGESLPARITQKTQDGPPIPSRPGNLHVLVKHDTASVNWATAHAPEYEITYGLEDKYPDVIGRQTTGHLTFLVKYLAPDSRYFIEVRAFNASGYSEPSQATIKTDPDMTQPRTLRNPGRTFSEAWLTWESPVDSSYLLDYEITCPGREPVRTTAREYIATGLRPEVQYLFRVQPRRLEGPVPALPVSISLVTHDRVPPTRPQALKLTSIAPGSATLSWRASEDNVGVTGYEVRRNEGAWAPVNGTSHPFVGLIDDGTDTFKVRAKDAAANLSVSACFSRKSSQPSAPSAPKSFRVKLGLIPLLE